MNEVAEPAGTPPPPDLLLQEGGADAAAVLLRRYAPKTATWDLTKDGHFWDAVRAAHDLGRLGDGMTVAVIDTGFDVGLPALAPHATADAIVPGAPTAHGTVAALLALEVAPRARLRMYAASEDGALSPERVIAAIERAVIEGADIINLSMGIGTPDEALWAKDGPRGNPAYERGALLDPDDWRTMYDVPGVPLWVAARAAVEAGVTVVASAGNYARYTFVPAAVPGVVSVGFHTVLREVDPVTGVDEARSAPPTYSQSLGADVMVVQPAHVLGSSFACPLISGFAAVMRDRRELPAFLRCVRRAGNAADMLRISEPGDSAEYTALLDSQFKAAFGSAPRRHYERPDGRSVSGSARCSPTRCSSTLACSPGSRATTGGVRPGRHGQADRSVGPACRGELRHRVGKACRQGESGRRRDRSGDLHLAGRGEHGRRRPSASRLHAVRARPRTDIDRCRTPERNTPMAEQGIRIRIDDDEDLAVAREAAERQGVGLEEVTGPPSGGLDSQVDPVTAVSSAPAWSPGSSC